MTTVSPGPAPDGAVSEVKVAGCSRRSAIGSVLFALGGLAFPRVAAAQAAATPELDPDTLTWDRSKANAIWAAARPRFIVQTDFDLAYESARRPAYGTALTVTQMDEVQGALRSASAFYKARGMSAPALPTADGGFQLFFVTEMGDVNGAFGEMRGSVFAVEKLPDTGTLLTMADLVMDIVPPGNHLAINAENFFKPAAVHPWAPRVTLAHELLHAVDLHTLSASLTEAMVADNVGKWWAEGNIEATAPRALRDVGFDPLKLWDAGHGEYAQNVGMRPYDYSLCLKRVPPRRPTWVRGRQGPPPKGTTEAALADSFWKFNATYFTSSFWRFILKEEAPYRGTTRYGATTPGDFELMLPLRRMEVTPADISAVAGNPHLDAGIPVLDRFLRNHHPTWGASGLHRAFPAFIAHWIEWPDQVVKSRKGHYEHLSWLETIFMDGVKIHDLTPDQPIVGELEIWPMAAKAIQFQLPTEGPTSSAYPPISITVSIIEDNGQANAIDNVHVGLRGQCLPNAMSAKLKSGSGRVRRWPSVKGTPLKRRAVNGYTILSFINVAPDPAKTRPVKIRFEVAMQVASAAGQLSYNPVPIVTPEGKTVRLPPSQPIPGPDTVPVVPVEKTRDGVRLTIIKDADMVRMMGTALDMASAMAVERDADDARAPMLGDPAVMAAMAAKMSRDAKTPLHLELTLPQLEMGYSGPVGNCTVTASWNDPVYRPFQQYGVNTGVTMETDAVQVQVVTSEAGMITGSFRADFSAGSQNTEAAYRGTIQGKFQTSVVRDEDETDEKLPEDPGVCLPSDFFVGAARAGMDQAALAAAIADAAANMSNTDDSSENGIADSADNAAVAGSNAQGDGSNEAVCSIGERTPESRFWYDQWFDQNFKALGIFGPDDLAQLREFYWENWELVEQLYCASRMAP